MKILFLCGGAEPGKDGIGDYTRSLARELAGLGHHLKIVAFRDKYVDNIVHSSVDVNCVQIPAALGENERISHVQKELEMEQPDWVSLQFVSYAFRDNGILLPSFNTWSKLLSQYRVHMMFHELWIGEEQGAPLKRKVVGCVQKHSILQFIRKIKPALVHTSIPIYQQILAQYHLKAHVLPLFSNIRISPVHDKEATSLYELMGHKRKGSQLIGGLFGSIYHESWDLESILILLKELQVKGYAITLCAIGKMEAGKDFWDSLKARYTEFNFVSLGPREEDFISQWLQTIDFGMITTPYLLLGKSGSYMAMKEHGLPVFCDKNKIRFNFDIDELQLKDGYAIPVGMEVGSLLQQIYRRPQVAQLRMVAEKLLQNLSQV